MKKRIVFILLCISVLIPRIWADFTIGLMPDTQILAWNGYDSWGRTAEVNEPLTQQETLNSMTEYYVDNKTELNVTFVASLGDMVESNNNGTEWARIDQAYSFFNYEHYKQSPHLEYQTT